MRKNIISIITSVCAFLWFTPWIFNPHDTLGLYILSFVWFCFIAWGILISKVILLLIGLKKKDQKWKHHLYSSIIIIVSYIVIILGVINNFIVTV